MGLCLEDDYRPAGGGATGREFLPSSRQAPKKSLRLYGLAPSPLRAHPSVYTVSSFFL
jgi:hypothetical protein